VELDKNMSTDTKKELEAICKKIDTDDKKSAEAEEIMKAL
jgi:hypothetical protein